MKKVICDYCGSESNDIKEYIVPVREHNDVRDRNNILVFRLYHTVDIKKDICPECREKVATLMNLIPKMQIRNNSLAATEITISS